MDFSEDFQQVYYLATQIRDTKNHNTLTPEHMLLAVLEDPVIDNLLWDMQIDPLAVRKELEAHLDVLYPQEDPFFSAPEEDEASMHGDSAELRHLLRWMYQYSVAQGRNEMGCGEFIIALLNNKDNIMAARFLDMEVKAVAKYLGYRMNNIPRDFENSEEEEMAWNENSKGLSPSTAAKDAELEDFPTIKDFCTNLNSDAKNGQFKPLIGRDQEVQQVIQTLIRKEKNNPLLAGESGGQDRDCRRAGTGRCFGRCAGHDEKRRGLFS